MTYDQTEATRRALIESGTVALQAAVEEALEQTWTAEQLKEEFEVLGFLAPFVSVRRRSDGVKGTLEFRHSPRIYFNFQPE